MIRLFRHYVPRALLLLASAEALILIGSMYLGRSLRLYAYGMSQAELHNVLPTAVIFTAVMIVIMTAMGLYERHFWNGKADMILRVAVSFFLGLFVMTLIFYMLPDLYLGRGEYGQGFMLALVGVILVRFGFLHLSDRDILKRRVLVLGTGTQAAQIEHLPTDILHAIKIVGYVRLPAEQSVVDPTRILPSTGTLYELTEHYQID